MFRRLAMSVGMLSALAAASLAVAVQSAATIGGSAASASTLATLDCNQPFGGDYLASLSSTAATVTLNSDCTNGPYYLVVYSASDNVADPVNTSSGTQLCPSPVDPNSYCSFPPQSDYPQFLQSTASFTNASATVPLPSSCWQLDVITNPVSTPSVLYNVTSGPGAFVWGEIGPPDSTCTPGGPPPSALTIGYWKNHTGAMAPLLPQTLGNYVVSTTDEGVAVLSDPSAKYAANQLAAQLLGAELNLAAGAASCPALTSAVQDANSLLAANSYAGPPSTLFGPGSASRAEAVNDAAILNNYNNGALC